MKKPLPVKIVEVLGWMYVALSVVWIIVLIVAQVFGIDQEGEVWPLVLCGSFPLLLSLGMVLSLRRGRSGWFLVPNTVVFSLFLLGAIVSLTSLEGAVIAGVIALLLVAPIALLWSPSASRWFNTMSGDDSPGPVGCALGMLLVFLGSIGGCFVSDYQTRNYTRLARLHAMSFRARELSKMMAENEGAGKSGAEWIDPAVCTNSTQFIQHGGKKSEWIDVCLSVEDDRLRLRLRGRALRLCGAMGLGAAVHGTEALGIAGLAGASVLGSRCGHRRGRTGAAVVAGIAAARSTAGIAAAPGLSVYGDRDHSRCGYCDQGECGQAFHNCVILVNVILLGQGFESGDVRGPEVGDVGDFHRPSKRITDKISAANFIEHGKPV